MPTHKDTAKKETISSADKPTLSAKATEVKKTAPRARKSKVAGAGESPHLRIRIRAYEHKILDASLKQIMDTAARYDAEVHGPVPLPTEIKKYTVNRSSFIDKNSREQFEMRVHKRLIDIINPNPKVIEALTNLSLPSGVNIDVKMM
ncbi:MAG: 30S ribosomal protein S10 [Patescibacteria group bacterium]|nr:30S ribosomal protein S10 [Patescibacteria group bacterium]MDE2172479.1 30S ribosomal protein S10 [Patescibacteria group bacterium]